MNAWASEKELTSTFRPVFHSLPGVNSAILIGMDDVPAPKLRWYRLTPDRLILGLLAVEAFLLLSEWRCWLPLNQHKGWTVLTAVAVVALMLLLLLVWFAASLILRWRFQYSLRSLLLLVVAVAVACSWLTTEIQRAKRQREAVAGFLALNALVEYKIGADSVWIKESTNFYNSRLQSLLGNDFFAKFAGVTVNTDADVAELKEWSDIENLWFNSPAITDAALPNLRRFRPIQLLDLSQTQVTDSGLAHLQGLYQLKRLYLSYTQIGDAGLVHLKGLGELRYLSLVETAVTGDGVKRLHRALPHCDIYYSTKLAANPGAR